MCCLSRWEVISSKPTLREYLIGDRKEVKMNKYIQKLKTEILDSVKNNTEEKDVVAIIERSVNRTLRYVDTQVSTHKFFKDV